MLFKHGWISFEGNVNNSIVNIDPLPNHSNVNIEGMNALIF
jgi:hypothetical protein